MTRAILESFAPDFPNPYPEPGWSRIGDFGYRTPLHLWRAIEAVRRRQGEDADYLLARPYTIAYTLDGAPREITVPEGLVTDLSSVPWWARWLIGRVGPHLEASIVHDFLYLAWQDLVGYQAKDEDRAFADRLLRLGMRSAGVDPVRCFLIYWAVRLAGRGVYRGRDDTRYMRERPTAEPRPASDPPPPAGAEA